MFHNKKLFIAFFMYGYFYKHLLNSIFISLNNYLGYAYIFEIENSITQMFKWYVNLQLNHSAIGFLISLELFFMILATIVTLM